jgi:hypothetical protein
MLHKKKDPAVDQLASPRIDLALLAVTLMGIAARLTLIPRAAVPRPRHG